MTLPDEICAQIDEALKRFGEYTWWDRGHDEVMDTSTIIGKLEQLDIAELKAVLLTVYAHSEEAESFIISIIEDWYDEAEGEELTKLFPEVFTTQGTVIQAGIPLGDDTSALDLEAPPKRSAMNYELVVTIRYRPGSRWEIDPDDDFKMVDDANILQASFADAIKHNDGSVFNAMESWNLFNTESPDIVTWEVREVKGEA